MKSILSTLSAMALLALATHCSCKKENGNTPPPPIYKLTFSVTPTGAKVELKKNDANGDPVTGSDNVFSNLPPGNYYYSVSATGYDTQTGTVEITNKDVTQKIDLTLIVYTLTFNVTPSGSKVELKENDANGDPITGSDNVFSNLLPGNYYYSASKTGYDTETGTVEISNADVTKEITLYMPFVTSLTMKNPLGAYHWVYFDVEADGNTPFEGTLYFLLKKADQSKPSVNDIMRHPNRMSRTVSVTKGTAKTVTKNFTGLSGDAVVNSNYEFEGDYLDFGSKRLEGVGHVLEGGAAYKVWVLAVAEGATPKDEDIQALGNPIQTQAKADVQNNSSHATATDFKYLDVNVLRIYNSDDYETYNINPGSRLEVHIGSNERLMIPKTLKVTKPINFIATNTKKQGEQGITGVSFVRPDLALFDTKYGRYNNSSTLTPESKPNHFEKVFFSVELPLTDVEFNKVVDNELYTIISTELITDNTTFVEIGLNGGNPAVLVMPLIKVP